MYKGVIHNETKEVLLYGLVLLYGVLSERFCLFTEFVGGWFWEREVTGQSGVLRCLTKQLNDDGEKGQPERIQVKGAEHLG